jgi:hypothetical protein
LAAELALRGFSSNPDVIDNATGFAKAFAGDVFDENELSRSLGREWDVLETDPTARAKSPATDAELLEKFYKRAENALTRVQAERVAELALSIETIGDLREYGDALVPVR